MGFFDFVEDIFDTVAEIAAPVLAAAAVVFTAGSAIPALGMASWGSVAGSIGGMLGEGLLGSMVSGAIQYAGYGAITGGITAAISGGDIMKGITKGALFGAATGGVLGGVNAAGWAEIPGIAKPTSTPFEMFQATATPQIGPQIGPDPITTAVANPEPTTGILQPGEGQIQSALEGGVDAAAVGGTPTGAPPGDLLGGQRIAPNIPLPAQSVGQAPPPMVGPGSAPGGQESFLSKVMASPFAGNALLGVGMAMNSSTASPEDQAEAERRKMEQIQANYGSPEELQAAQALTPYGRLQPPSLLRSAQNQLVPMRDYLASGRRASAGGYTAPRGASGILWSPVRR